MSEHKWKQQLFEVVLETSLDMQSGHGKSFKAQYVNRQGLKKICSNLKLVQFVSKEWCDMVIPDTNIYCKITCYNMQLDNYLLVCNYFLKYSCKIFIKISTRS